MKKQVSTPESHSQNKQSTPIKYVPITPYSPSHLPKPSYQPNHVLKSPSPDTIHANILTPSKIKYIGDQAKSRGLDRTPYSSEKNFVKIFDASQHQKKQQYIKQLQGQVQNLQNQNKSLQKNIQQLMSKSKANSRTNSETNSIGGMEGGRRNMLIIEKIKEQYRENLGTLKLMIEQQIKQSNFIVEDTCKLLQNRINQLEERVENAEKIVHLAKIKYIMGQQNKMAESYDKGSSSPIKSMNRLMLAENENTLSDIFCSSIPEEEWEQSKNSIMVSKLQTQIQKLKRTIQQNQKAFETEKQSYQQIIQKQQSTIKLLEDQSNTRDTQHHKTADKYEGFHNLVKEELRSLQTTINQIADQLLSSKQLNSKTLIDLEEKTNELEIANREIIILRDKIVDLEKHRNLLEQKNRFLQSTLQISEKQLKERRTMLDNALNSQSLVSKQKLLRYQKSVDQFVDEHNPKTTITELTARIDRLLQLQQNRQAQILSNTTNHTHLLKEQNEKNGHWGNDWSKQNQY